MSSLSLPVAPSPLIDIGVNLTHRSFQEDLDAVLKRAHQANVRHLLVTGTTLEESHAALELCLANPGIMSCTAGFHPHHASELQAHHLQDLKALAQQPPVKAIGECGLDFFRMFSPMEKQILAFERQLELAIALQMPLFLHERDAHQRQWEILKSYRDDLAGGVIHCFTGTKAEAFRYLDLDLYLGITGWICDERRGQHLHEFVADIPLHRLLIETDAPYLLPRIKPALPLPVARRNEPCALPVVLEEIARHHNADMTQIAEATTNNARRLFNLDE